MKIKRVTLEFDYGSVEVALITDALGFKLHVTKGLLECVSPEEIGRAIAIALRTARNE